MHITKIVAGLVACLPLVTLATPVSGLGLALSSASAFTDEVLDAHNKARARHGAPPLSWDNTLAQAAYDWANRCPANGQEAIHSVSDSFTRPVLQA
jgi:uncharacterized protein YkwD